MLAGGLAILHGDSEVEAQPADVRERVRRIDRERGQNREHLLGEVSGQALLLVVRQIVPPDDRNAFGSQSGQDRVEEDEGVAARDLLGAARDERELRSWRQPVGGADRQAGLGATLEAGDAHHVELVEIRSEDGEELGAFEQRQRRVLGQREHPRVEVEPAQFAVEVAVRGQTVGDGLQRRGGGRGARRRGRTGSGRTVEAASSVAGCPGEPGRVGVDALVRGIAVFHTSIIPQFRNGGQSVGVRHPKSG